jgi:ABC-2 type transport system permease protein
MEIRSQLKSFLIWTVSILALFAAFMTGMYDAFMNSRDALENMINGFPPALADAFGIHLDEMFSYGGFFSFSYMYVSLFGAIMATYLSVSVFSREKRSKCVDFLLAKPVSRTHIFAMKLSGVLTLLVVLNILFIAVTLILFDAKGDQTTKLSSLAWAACALFFMQLVFSSFGIVFAVFARKIRSVSGIATAFGFGGFILTALHNLLEKEAIRFIAPLNYFSMESVFSTGGYEPRYTVTAAAVFAVCLGAAFIKFRDSDTPAA